MNGVNFIDYHTGKGCSLFAAHDVIKMAAPECCIGSVLLMRGCEGVFPTVKELAPDFSLVLFTVQTLPHGTVSTVVFLNHRLNI